MGYSEFRVDLDLYTLAPNLGYRQIPDIKLRIPKEGLGIGGPEH